MSTNKVSSIEKFSIYNIWTIQISPLICFLCSFNYHLNYNSKIKSPSTIKDFVSTIIYVLIFSHFLYNLITTPLTEIFVPILKSSLKFFSNFFICVTCRYLQYRPSISFHPRKENRYSRFGQFSFHVLNYYYNVALWYSL
jgi:hypothetical protein